MKPAIAAKSRSRRFLVQALYQAQLTGDDFADVIEPFIAEHNMKRADLEYFREVLRGIHRDQDSLKLTLEKSLDRQYDDLDPIERAILLLGSYELASRIEVPYKVVINESVELAKMFGATDSYKYVNSILDVLAKESRSRGPAPGSA